MATVEIESGNFLPCTSLCADGALSHMEKGESLGCEKRTQKFVQQAAFEPETATLCSHYTPRTVRAAGTLTRSRLAHSTGGRKEGLSARRYNLASCLGVQADLKMLTLISGLFTIHSCVHCTQAFLPTD
jgi:hypothetical protein